MLTTKDIGDITELQCILAFRERGIAVSIPFGDSAPYDLVVELGGELKKIQCKTSRKGRSEGAYVFNTSIYHTNTKETIKKTYEGKIDYFMTIIEGQPCLVPISDCGVKDKTLRTTPPKNGQVTGVAFAATYHLDRYT